MNPFKNYTDYLKDNPNQYWFKRKLYGWGWTPVKWQGWLVLFVWIVFFFCGVVTMKFEPTKMFVFTVLAVGLLFYICYKKGEKPGWRWGPPDSK